MPVKPIPDGYHTVTPYMIVKGASQAIDFYQRAFGAIEKFRLDGPNGTVMHAELQIGNSRIMLTDEHPNMGAKSAQTLGGSPISIMLYVEDVDARYAQAIAAGGKVFREVKDQFYGDRSGCLTDPFGIAWTIATHKEDVSHDEMDRRFAEMMKQQCKG